MNASIQLPALPFTVRMCDTANLAKFDVSATKLYTVTKVTAVSEGVLGYKLLEVPMAEHELFDARRFSIYAISAPN